jgi:tRNA (mo5U34)-methyltransferase
MNAFSSEVANGTFGNPAELRKRIDELGEWFHNIDLGGVQTAPHHFLGNYPEIKWSGFKHAIPSDLRGKSVLDIGCNGGFYSIEMKKRGADRVVGIDFDDRYLAQARFAAEMSGVDIEFRKMSVYEIDQLKEKFDWVLFMGVLYHLRHPLYVLDLLHDHVVKDRIVFQSLMRGSTETPKLEENYSFHNGEIFETEGYPLMYFVEKKYAGDPTNWWIPNRACAEAMLRSSGFRIVDHPEAEVYICAVEPTRESD